MKGFITFECDELKLVHKNVLLDGYVKKPLADSKFHFEVHFGLREPLNILVGQDNAEKLEKRLMDILQKQEKEAEEINKKFDSFFSKEKRTKRKK